jgi:hypothetical protein
MSMLCYHAAALAAMLLAGLGNQAALAQCGATAAQQTKCCSHETQADAGPHGTLMIGLNSQWVYAVVETKPDPANPKGCKATVCVPINDCCPVVGPAVGSCAEVFAQCVAPLADMARCCAPGVNPAQPTSVPETAEMTCPYLRQQAAEKHMAATDEGNPDRSALENLKSLETAHHLCRQADHYRRTGHPTAAAELYRRVQRLCPGSHYAQMATDRLLEIEKQPETAPAATETVPPLSKGNPPPEHPQRWVVLRPQMPETEDTPAVDPTLEDPDPTVVPEQEEAGLDDEAGQPAPEWNENFLRLLEDLPGGVSWEFDDSREDGLRAECEIEVAGVNIRLTWNQPGVPLPALEVIHAPEDSSAESQEAAPEWLNEWLESLEDSPFSEPAAKPGPRDH